MAQNGPHGHQVGAAGSDDSHTAPPTTVAFSLTSAGPYGNGGSSSAGNMENMDASAGKGKNLIPDLNMDDRDSAGSTKEKPRLEASASLSLTAMPQTTRGMAALCASDIPHGGVPVPPAAPVVPASPPRCKTWTWPNVALTVANDAGYIRVSTPLRANILTMLMSVLHNHGIDVITAKISSDRGRALFMIYAQVTGIGGENGRSSSEEVYQRAMSEIMYRLRNNNN